MNTEIYLASLIVATIVLIVLTLNIISKLIVKGNQNEEMLRLEHKLLEGEKEIKQLKEELNEMNITLELKEQMIQTLSEANDELFEKLWDKLP